VEKGNPDPSILIVDDEPMARDLIRLMLERANFNVSEAIDGYDALEKVKKAAPDLIILDVMMPGMDGFAFCRTLRNDQATTAIPVIMLSARTHPESVREGLEAGATRYLSKLVSRKDLVQNIRDVLSGVSDLELE
jgi:DNA-binding response OmpR family regulator